MISDKNQRQQAGDESTNLQAQSIVINQGISYSDAKAIALDVYKSNFLELSKDAAQLARNRAEELTDTFLKKLEAENSSAIDTMKEPAMQAALYEAQKQYAKTGDKDLEGLLVDILVERASVQNRNIYQIVLDEALVVAAKLTAEQMDALTINFLISNTSNRMLSSLPAIPVYIQTYLMPFVDYLSDNSSCYEHLEYVGCGSLLHMGGLKSIEQIFHETYGGLFSKGFDGERLEKEIENSAQYSFLITRCLHDLSLLQVNAISVEVINNICAERKVPDNVNQKITNLFNSTRMSPQDIRKYLISVAPQVDHLFDLWDKSKLSKFVSTTVGIAIAQANFRRKTGIKLDLSIWVK